MSEEGVSRDGIAVFYRVNAQSRVLEDTLVRFEIPYQVIGGTKFYERAEIKDAVAYLSLLVNPADSVSFARIVNSPRRGIGDTTQARLLVARQHHRPGHLGRHARGRARPRRSARRPRRPCAGSPTRWSRCARGWTRAAAAGRGAPRGGAERDRVHGRPPVRAHDRGGGESREPPGAGGRRRGVRRQPRGRGFQRRRPARGVPRADLALYRTRTRSRPTRAWRH